MGQREVRQLITTAVPARHEVVDLAGTVMAAQMADKRAGQQEPLIALEQGAVGPGVPGHATGRSDAAAG